MEKNRLIRVLKNASELEENHTQVVIKFFLEDFNWQSVEKEKQERVIDILKIIRHQTSAHEKILNDLITFVNDSDENEF